MKKWKSVAAALMEWRIYALPGGIFPQGLSFCVFCGVALKFQRGI